MTTAGHTAECKQDSTQAAAREDGFSIGFRYPPMPAGLEDPGGFAVAPKNGPKTDLAIAYIRDRKGIVIWLDQIICRNGCTNPDYVIIDYRRIPTLSDKEYLVHNCRQAMSLMVATDSRSLLQKTKTARRSETYMAWRVDVKARRLVEISPDEIHCINDEFLERE